MKVDKTTYSLATLDLVCPPIPNSLAVRLTGDPVAERVIRRSDFYMIGGRPQATFGDFDYSPGDSVFAFSIEVQGGKKDFGLIRMDGLAHLSKAEDDVRVRISYRDTEILFFAHNADGSEELFAGFSPDEILMRRGRKDHLIGGFDNYLELACFDLLYVGIAKVGDSYDRLFANGHKARMEILANEPQRYPGARVSDETYLFLFAVEPLMIKTFGVGAEVEDGDVDFSYDNKRLVADAEKAFVHVLKPKYNSQLYPNYPKGKDGLYGTGLTAYTYSISEGITFRTPVGIIKGDRERKDFTMSNKADFISVKGDEVTVHISGKDFNV